MPTVAATITANGIQLRNAWTLATISPRGELVEFVDISNPNQYGRVHGASRGETCVANTTLAYTRTLRRLGRATSCPSAPRPTG